MDKQKATEIFQRHLNEWLENMDRNENGYEYQRTFVEQMQKLEIELFQDSLGEAPKSKNSKKSSNHMRENISAQDPCFGKKSFRL